MAKHIQSCRIELEVSVAQLRRRVRELRRQVRMLSGPSASPTTASTSSTAAAAPVHVADAAQPVTATSLGRPTPEPRPSATAAAVAAATALQRQLNASLQEIARINHERGLLRSRLTDAMHEIDRLTRVAFAAEQWCRLEHIQHTPRSTLNNAVQEPWHERPRGVASEMGLSSAASTRFKWVGRAVGLPDGVVAVLYISS